MYFSITDRMVLSAMEQWNVEIHEEMSIENLAKHIKIKSGVIYNSLKKLRKIGIVDRKEIKLEKKYKKYYYFLVEKEEK